MIDERQYDVPVEEEAFPFAGMGDIGELMRTDIQLFRKDLAVARRLVEHIDEIRVLENILDLMGGEQVLHVLRNAGRDTAPFAEPLPDLDRIGCGLFLLEEQMELIHIVPGRPPLAAVGSDTAPYLVLDDEHADLLELLSEFLDVIADEPVVDVHICPVVEQVQGALDIDLERRRHMVCLLLLLREEGIIQILEDRHVLRPGIVEILLVDVVHTAVDDRLLHRLQAFLPADDELAQGQDEVRLEGDGVVLLRIVGVDVHRVDELRAGRADVDDLPLQPVDERSVLGLRVADDDVVIRHEEGVGDLPLGAEGLA